MKLAFLLPCAAAALSALLQAQSTVYVKYGDFPGDWFGESVAGAGDVNADGVPDFVVGARREDDFGQWSGSVRVYSGANSAPLYTFYGENANEFLGDAVAGAGDVDADGYDDVIVGASKVDANGVDSGRVRVYSGQTGAILHSIDGLVPGGHFGAAVSAAGDVDQDGHADFAVGAQHTPNGDVHVYSGIDGHELHAWSGDDTNDQFGHALHGGGDIDADGVPDLLVGAYLDDNAGEDSGSVYAFSGASGALLFRVDGDAPEDQLGRSVAILGDVDGDLHADVAMGAPFFGDDPGWDNGRIKVVSGATGALLYQLDVGHSLGASMAVGDVDGDGVPDFVAGPAPYAPGIVRAYSGVDGTLLAEVPDGSDENFGFSVGMVGDVNGDTLPEIVIGVPGHDNYRGRAEVVDAFVDCNQNGIHDGQELVGGVAQDCNGNLVLDECDLAQGTEADCNGNAVPDGCEPDCNLNGIPDDCDLSAGTSTDCDNDLVPDECQLPPRATFTDVSPDFPGLQAGVPHVHTLVAPPGATSDVTLTLVANGDLDASSDWVFVELNSTLLDLVFGQAPTNCIERTDTVVVPAETYNALVLGGDAVFTLTPSSSVSGTCGGEHLQLTTSYQTFGPGDCNGNAVDDACEIVTGVSLDLNGNGVPDDCEFTSYCLPAANSTGQPALMSWRGTNSVAANGFVLVAAPLPFPANGLFVYSPDQDYVPLGNGFLCLGTATQGFVNRLPFESSDALGTMSHALDLTAPALPESTITPGSTWNFQCWFRDVPAGGAGFNFSDGLQVLFQP